MTESDPTETVRRVHRGAPTIPILVFAGIERQDEARRCLGYGALNCLFQGNVDRLILDRLLQNAVERNTVGALTDLLRDPVTGLYVLDALLMLGTQVMDAARRTEGKVVLYYGVLENWKRMCAELGQASAEKVLREFAALLQQSFRRTDYVARVTEEQFAMLAVDAAEPSAAILRQRIERRLAVFNNVRPAQERLEFRGNAVFWDSKDARDFAGLLASCADGLQKTVTGTIEHNQSNRLPAQAVQ